ncbi:MAG: GyrI-like domain-containing protein [Anaerolineae bacterium]
MPESTAANTAATPTPEPSFGPMRVQNMRGFTYFYVTKRTTMENIKEDVGDGMGKVMTALAAAGAQMDGPYVFTYIMGGDMSDFEMRIGFPVPAGTQATGDAEVAVLGEFRCASLIYSGGYQHVTRAWEELMQAMRREGLTPLAESREWYLYAEEPSSPNNVTMIQTAI